MRNATKKALKTAPRKTPQKALIALDSTSTSGRNFDRFTNTLCLFQRFGIIPEQTIVASVYHPNLAPLPFEFYASEKERLASEARAELRVVAQGRFDFEATQILLSNSSSTAEHVHLLSSYAKRINVDFLVVGSNDRSGLPYWFLGSFAEVATLDATLPVLVIKPHMQSLTLSREPRFVVAIDVATPPSNSMIQWICDLVGSANASLELIHVIPRHRPFLDALQMRKTRKEARDCLLNVKKRLDTHGAKSKIHLKEESASIAHTVVEFADDVNAWLTMTLTADRTRAHRFFLGSRARRILSLSKRPFMNVRIDH